MASQKQTKLYLSNLESTQKFGQHIGQVIKPNTVLALSGEIGSGKTTLVKAITKALCVKEAVSSPTFVMMNEYHSGRLSVYHIDLYRLLDQSDKNISFELIAAQLEEVLNTEAIIIIEWAELFSDRYGQNLNRLCENGILSLNITADHADSQARRLTMTIANDNTHAFYLFEELCKFSKDILIENKI